MSTLTREQVEALVRHHTIGWGPHSKVDTFLNHDQAQRDTIAALQSEVHEWICERCNMVYPGPPTAGYDCVQCPKCHGMTGPRLRIEIMRLKQELARLKATVKELEGSHKSMLENFTAMRLAAGGSYDTMDEAVSRVFKLKQAQADLLKQLPEGMEHCTIRFLECPKGHGRLTATNWVQHGCRQCAIDDLLAEAVWAMGTIQELIQLNLDKEDQTWGELDKECLAHPYYQHAQRFLARPDVHQFVDANNKEQP